MGDPFSMAVSATGLLSLGLQSTEYLYKFYTAYRDQGYDLAKIADEIDDLRHSLQIIDDVLRTRTWRTDEQTILRHIETSLTRCKDVIDELRDQAAKFEKLPSSDLKKAIVGAGRRVAYPFRHSTLEKLSEDVHDFRDNLSLIIQILELKEHQRTHSDLEEVKHIVKSAQAQHVSASLRQWLKAPDASVDYNRACSKRHAGTGQWLVDSTEFKNWLLQENSLLWLYGFAGCGKSVLCSTAIQHAFRHQQSQSKSAVVFFFLTFNDESKQDCFAILKALLFQLSGQVSGVEAELARLQSVYNHSMPPVSTLMAYLHQAIARCRHVYIFLDALDESPEKTSREEVLSMIEVMRSWQISGLHLLLTSRDIPDIRSCLDHQKDVLHTEHILLNNESISGDIREYVSYRVEHERELRRWSDDDRQRIKDYLSKQANSVFRWVRFQLDPLKRCPRSSDYLENCLRSLPRSLDDMYERMLHNIGEECQKDALRLLSLLCYASRPLSVEEVTEALAVDIDNLQCYCEGRRLNGLDDLLRICPGLIEIVLRKSLKDLQDDQIMWIRSPTRQNEAEKIPPDYVVVLSHFSVKEYLVSERVKLGSMATFALSVSEDQHARIAKTCLLYLTNRDLVESPLSPQLLQRYSWAKYAARYWHHHYRHAGEQFDLETFERVAAFMTTKSTFDRWAMLYHTSRLVYDQIGDVDERSTNDMKTCGSPAHSAAVLDFYDIIIRIISKSQPDANTQGILYNNALQVASMRGERKIVQLLLEKGALVNAQAGKDRTALAAAAGNGHDAIVQMLLDWGAEINASEQHQSALELAAAGGHTKTLEILLSEGANINNSECFSPALIAAAAGGNEKIVKILLDRGAAVNVPEEYVSALEWAALSRSLTIVQLLLDKGADANVRGWMGPPLQIAANHGLEDMVGTLLDHGADVNAQGYSDTALHAASEGGWEGIVQILLDHGANINARGQKDNSALQAAVDRGHERVVKMLIEQGADLYGLTDDISALDTVNSLGVLFAEQSKLNQAEQAFELVLKGREKLLGLDHTSTLKAVLDLGLLYVSQKELEKAERMYDRFLSTHPAHWISPQLRGSINNLVVTLGSNESSLESSSKNQQNRVARLIGHTRNRGENDLLVLHFLAKAFTAIYDDQNALIAFLHSLQNVNGMPRELKDITCDGCEADLTLNKGYFVCRCCLDTDLCKDCMLSYANTSLCLSFCGGHDYYDVGTGLSQMIDLAENQDDMKMEVWLTRLEEKYRIRTED